MKLRYPAAILLTLAVLHAPAGADVPDAGRAGVVVRSGDTEVGRMCVLIDHPGMTGVDVLQKSGMDVSVESTSFGAAVCRIDGVGCRTPEQKCFCDASQFWGYWTKDVGNTAFVNSQVGASSRIVKGGSVDAWVYGDGKTVPPEVAFADVCPAKAAAAAASATPAKPTNKRGSYAYAGFIALLAVVLLGAVLMLRRRRGAA